MFIFNTKNFALILISSLLLFLAGCENLPKENNQAIDKQQDQTHIKFNCSSKCSIDSLKHELSHWLLQNDALGYFEWLDQSIANNGKEIILLLKNEQELNNHDPFTNLFLSLSLSYPGTGFRDTSQALTSLEKFNKNWLIEDQNKRFGVFLKRQLDDRQRMIEQRSDLRKKLANIKEQLSKEQGIAVEAKTQLDQLKSVEKSLLRQQSEETKKYRVVK